jgi:hypothetical protein
MTRRFDLKIPPFQYSLFQENAVKLHIRKSALKGRKLHGFRAKPYSHKPRGKKLKNLKLMLKARRKRRIHLDGSN